MAQFFKAEEAIMTKLKNELAEHLTYHSYFHTLDVLNAAMQIAETEHISKEELSLLRIAAAYHDSGFLEVYKGHEQKSCEYARRDLPAFDFTNEQIEIICGIIMATKIPQSPTTKLQEIIADADLDYLGRSDYKHIAAKLFAELKVQNVLKEESEWIKLQESFIQAHHYFTDFSKTTREPVKQQHLKELMGQ
jgi:uncharacterized protein